MVIDRLKANKFFLSVHKLFFFKEELNLPGHVIDDDGIHMDPAKVDEVSKWKTPTNKTLLASFIGSVGYLAPGCMGVRIPMQCLSKMAAPTSPWVWNETEQRTFDLVKSVVTDFRLQMPPTLEVVVFSLRVLTGLHRMSSHSGRANLTQPNRTIPCMNRNY